MYASQGSDAAIQFAEWHSLATNSSAIGALGAQPVGQVDVNEGANTSRRPTANNAVLLVAINPLLRAAWRLTAARHRGDQKPLGDIDRSNRVKQVFTEAQTI